MHMVISKNVRCSVLGSVRCSQVILSPCIVTWQLVGGVVVRSVVLDERGNRRDVAGVHGRHAGSSADGRGLVVQVQHSAGEKQVRRGASLYCKIPSDFNTEVENRFKFGCWTMTSGFHRSRKILILKTNSSRFWSTSDFELWSWQPQRWDQPLYKDMRLNTVKS